MRRRLQACRGVPARGVAIFGLGVQVVVGCAAQSRSPSAEGVQTKAQADRFVARAIRSSSEGFILMPSERAERVYERSRLNEIAQGMRQSAAACFLNRAIKTIERGEEGGRLTYNAIPEGQAKIRARISADGSVLRTEVLESGFKDTKMEPCVQRVIERQKWPQNKTGHTHYIDLFYWVSIGAQKTMDQRTLAERLRREQAGAGIRARQCLRGRVQPGHYAIEGLNLMDREGNTLVNRVEPAALPHEVAGCVAQAMKGIRIDRDTNAFVRPVSPTVEFDVRPDGIVVVKDEEWLGLVRAEEQAKRKAARAELEKPAEAIAAGEEPATGAEPASKPTVLPPTESTPAPAAADPAAAGLKLDLKGHRDDE